MWVVSQHFPFHCLLIATKMQSDINIVVVPMLWWISNNLPSLISHKKCEWCFQGPRWSPQANSHSIQASWSVNNPRTRLEKNFSVSHLPVWEINAQGNSFWRNTLGVSPFGWEKRPKTVFRGPSCCLACCCFPHQPTNRSARAPHTARAPTSCSTPTLLCRICNWLWSSRGGRHVPDWLKSKSVK